MTTKLSAAATVWFRTEPQPAMERVSVNSDSWGLCINGKFASAPRMLIETALYHVEVRWIAYYGDTIIPPARFRSDTGSLWHDAVRAAIQSVIHRMTVATVDLSFGAEATDESVAALAEYMRRIG